MSPAKSLASGLALLAALWIVSSPVSPVCADSIVLKNGSTIDGKIVEDGRGSGGYLVLAIGESGRMFFRASEIAQVVERPADAKAPEGDTAPASGGFVEVKLARGGSFYGGGSYFGTVSKASSSEKLVLAVPEAGTIAIPRSAIASISPIDAAAVAPAAARTESDATEITTYKAIYLKNGRKINGDLIETADEDQIKVRIGELGVLIFNEDEVADIRDERGTIKLPAPVAPAKIDPVDTAPMPTDEEILREEIKREIINEILDGILDRHVDTTLRTRRNPLATTAADSDEILAIQDAIRELGRQRTQNRIRAERQLVAAGPAALPYLELVVRHPLNLTRRAVQRIVRETADPAGVPLAIEGLTDPDIYVREIAHEALQKLLPEIVVPYAPNAPRRKLERAQAEYWALWDEIALEEAKAAVLEKLSRL